MLDYGAYCSIMCHTVHLLESNLKAINIYSAEEILLTPFFMGNKSKLARALKVSRSKLAKYLLDTDMNLHCVYLHNDKWVMRTSLIDQGRKY